MTTAVVASDVINWKQAMATNHRAVMFRGLTPEMLTEEGDVIETKDGDVVCFDADFVYHKITERIFKPLGLVAPDGQVKQKFILENLIPKTIEYAKTSNEREAESRRYEMATLMAKYNGRTVEENLELLMRKETDE